jgi:hypothetical protein
MKREIKRHIKILVSNQGEILCFSKADPPWRLIRLFFCLKDLIPLVFLLHILVKKVEKRGRLTRWF